MINEGRGFQKVSRFYRKNGVNSFAQLPTRADKKSAGYDFYLPCDITLKPHETKLVFTDIKAYMRDDEVLMLFIRSSVGVKLGVTLANGTGIIDASYYNNLDNDGNIGIALYNNSIKTVELKGGDRIAQGIFMKYLVASNEDILNASRQGGFGSSGK